MQYYSTVKKNETISFAATWMNLEIPNGSQVRQKEKTNTTVHMETHTSCPNKTVGNEPAAQPTQDLIPSETPRLWGAEHQEKRGRSYIPPSKLVTVVWTRVPLWGHLNHWGLPTRAQNCPPAGGGSRVPQAYEHDSARSQTLASPLLPLIWSRTQSRRTLSPRGNRLQTASRGHRQDGAAS